MYDALSIALIGDDSLSIYIQMLVSIHLFVNADYYANHDLLQKIYESNIETFPSFKAVFSLCLRDNAVGAMGDANKERKCDIQGGVKQEALSNCCPGSYSTMLCIIASATSLIERYGLITLKQMTLVDYR